MPQNLNPESSKTKFHGIQKKALVIDDDHTTLILAQAALTSHNFSVTLANDGESAIKCYQENGPYNLVLIDWNLPGMPGIELVSRFRQNQMGAKVKLMMVTAENDMAHLAEGLKQGADEYLMKPFTRDTLALKLRILGFES